MFMVGYHDSSVPAFGAGTQKLDVLPIFVPKGDDILRTAKGLVGRGQTLDTQHICVGQNFTKTNNYFVAGSALVGLYLVGTACVRVPFSEQESWINSPKTALHEVPAPTSKIIISGSAHLIDEAQSYSGLTLGMIAPLLGVSRRSIQNWKVDNNISEKNELQLRDLVETLKQISIGNQAQTRNLLLARVTGVPRIYDLLAERRYDAAIRLAKSPPSNRPILSDQTVKLNNRPIANQLAYADDGPAKFKGKLNRSVSRRIVR
jgi:hypothetical protein